MTKGWLKRQMDANSIEVATWPKYMLREAGFTDVGLTTKQKKEAARILRARAEELDPVND